VVSSVAIELVQDAFVLCHETHTSICLDVWNGNNIGALLIHRDQKKTGPLNKML